LLVTVVLSLILMSRCVRVPSLFGAP